MPLPFRKSFRILPGVRVTINRRSWSIITTGGRRGPRRTHNSAGRHMTSVDLPYLSGGVVLVPPGDVDDPSPERPPWKCSISYLR